MLIQQSESENFQKNIQDQKETLNNILKHLESQLQDDEMSFNSAEYTGEITIIKEKYKKILKLENEAKKHLAGIIPIDQDMEEVEEAVEEAVEEVDVVEGVDVEAVPEVGALNENDDVAENGNELVGDSEDENEEADGSEDEKEEVDGSEDEDADNLVEEDPFLLEDLDDIFGKNISDDKDEFYGTQNE